jgi:hypothetical protein
VDPEAEGVRRTGVDGEGLPRHPGCPLDAARLHLPTSERQRELVRSWRSSTWRSRCTCCCCGPAGQSGGTWFGAACTPMTHCRRRRRCAILVGMHLTTEQAGPEAALRSDVAGVEHDDPSPHLHVAPPNSSKRTVLQYAPGGRAPLCSAYGASAVFDSLGVRRERPGQAPAWLHRTAVAEGDVSPSSPQPAERGARVRRPWQADCVPVGQDRVLRAIPRRSAS